MKGIIYLLFFFSISSYAGFGLEATRVIYHGTDKIASFVAFNDADISTGENLLVQTWIEDLNGMESEHFLITPPIFKLNASEKNSININKIEDLPEDKESLYWINVRFISPEKKEEGKNSLNYSFTNKIKLIYRPNSLLNQSIDECFKLITIKKQGSKLAITNTTPFYININRMYLNNQEIDNIGYIPPKSTLKINSPKENGTLTIMFLNDLGGEVEFSYKIY